MFQTLLTRPPSVNTCFATDFRTRRRFASKKYVLWQNTTEVLSMLQSARMIMGKVTIEYRLGPTGSKRKTDVMNYEKPITDMLVKAGVIEDDHLVQRGTLMWDDKVPVGMVQVTVNKWREDDVQ